MSVCGGDVNMTTSSNEHQNSKSALFVERVLNKVSAAIIAMSTVLFILFSVICVSELSSRNSIHYVLNSNISKINEQISDLSSSGIPSDMFDSRLNSYLNEKEVYKDDLKRLLSLEVSSSFGFGYSFSSNNEIFFSSDLLLAISMIFCGGVGATISSLRKNKPAVLKQEELGRVLPSITADQFLGITAGFVAFFVVKGGESLMLTPASETTNLINPYGCALAAILAGLFTDRAYQVISVLFDQGAERIIAERQSNDQKGSGNSTGAKQLQHHDP